MTRYTDIMIDIETLGDRPGSVIASIGAVAFNQSDDGDLGPRFEVRLALQPQLDLGAIVTAGTLLWWFQQETSAQFATFFGEEMSPPEALLGLSEFIRETSVELPTIWGKPNSFDMVLLEDLYRLFQLHCPWHFRQVQDLRTRLKDFPVDTVEPTVAHSAVDDAVAQALTCQRSWALRQRALESLRTAPTPTA